MNESLTDKEFRELAIKCQEGTASEEEIIRFHEAYTLLLKRHTTWDEQLMGKEEQVRKNIFSELDSNIYTVRKQRRRFGFYRYAAAAILVMAIGAGLYFYAEKLSEESVPQQVQHINDIEPGDNKALLTLADGRQIVLSDAQDGELAKQAGISIRKTKDGQLIYHIESDVSDTPIAETVFNTISTPRGGQYQVVLPDGSQVWLNAASSIRFPASFKNQQQRKVELAGEAYFEVAKDKAKPFLVISGNQVTEVLGTHFNINAYSEESTVKTTLLEGAVSVSSEGKKVTILPGEQVVSDRKGSLRTENVNTTEAVAWVHGQFMFNSQDLGSIMRSVSRWYDVDVHYTANLSSKKFTGTISRYENVSQVLNMLELTGLVHFKVEGRRIVVMK